MPKIFDYKFILPPTLALIFLYWANPCFVLNLFHSPQGSGSAIFLGILGLFVAGFAISTFIYFFVNRYILSKIDEVNFWEKLAEEKEFLQQQVMKRWNMMLANANAAFALVLTFIVAWSYNLGASSVWYAVILVLFLCLCANTIWTYHSQKEIREKILEKK